MKEEQETSPLKVLFFADPPKRSLLDFIDWDGEAYKLLTTHIEEHTFKLLSHEKPDVIIVDYDHADIQPLNFLDKILEQNENLIIIGLTDKASLDIAVKSIKMGVQNVIHTKENPYQLQQELSKIIEKKKSYQNWLLLHDKEKKKFEFDNIVGQSPEMHRIFQMISMIRKLKWVTVLIRGETGTGKELIAKAIHYKVENMFRPFIEINCSTLPESLLESELFGFEKGAFTDAKNQKKGLFEMANDGTMFLDEIGEIAPAIQVKLLRVLEEKKIRRLGGTQDIYINTRIIAATNRNLESAIKEGFFRNDLYYRLNVICINVPPLRERGDDVILLAKRFLKQYAEEYNSTLCFFTDEAEALLKDYHWPGNVRELKHTIERIVLLKKGESIEKDILMESITSEIPLVMSEEKQTQHFKIEIPPGGLSLDEGEKILIRAILEKTGWNKRKTSHILNVSRPRLDRKIQKYKLSPR